MKKYYISYYKDFSNCFTIASCETPLDYDALNLMDSRIGEHFERITLKEARAKIAAEKAARKYDPEFSGYGSITIKPAYDLIVEGQEAVIRALHMDPSIIHRPGDVK